MDTEDKIKRAKIKLQSKNPFFSYLSLFLDFKEDTDGVLDEFAGMGVNSRGDLWYKKDFVDKLTEDELIGVISHEVLHLALLHLTRLGSRDMQIFNVACDLVVNSVLLKNHFALPQDRIAPNYYDTYEFLGLEIEKISEKTAEEIYSEMVKKIEKDNKKNKSKSKNGTSDGAGTSGNGNGNGKLKKELLKGRFDEHKQGESLTKEEVKELEDKWKDIVSSAYVNAKQRGELPLGLERLIGKLHKEKIDWKVLLRKHILSHIPTDYSYSKPHKKSVCTGYYMPSLVKDKIKIAIAIDTSGSIGQKELIDFLSEIIGIAKAYQNQIDMTLYTHDVKIHNEHEIKNGNIREIMNIKVSGGGGTSHKEVFEKINKDRHALAVFFTDGYSDLDSIDFKQNNFSSIFVINEQGTTEQLKNKLRTMVLKI